MKKKILFIIENNLLIRNYFETNAFNLIEEKFICTFLFKKTLKKNIKIKKNYFFFKENIKNTQRLSKIIIRKIYQNKEISTSYEFISNVYKNKISLYFKNQNIIANIFYLPKRLAALIFRQINFFYQKSRHLEIKDNFFLKNFEINQDIKNKINEFKPDLIIFPYQSMESEGLYSVLKIAKKNKIITLGLIDNWDNIFTRPMINLKSDYLTLWGDQSKKIAIKRHNYSKSNLFKLGTPRFDKYFTDRNLKLNNQFQFKYILFVEGWVWDQLDDVLQKLNSIIDNNKFLNKYKILYRPHPWRKSLELFDFDKYQNIELDPQLKSNFLKKNFDTSVQPKLEYYSSLIKNSELVISGPTSMVIESLIFRKKILLLSHNKKKTYSHHNFINKVENYKNIKDIESVKLCYDLNNLEKDILYLMKKNINNKNIDKQRNYFFYKNKLDYSKNILNIVNKVIAKSY